MNRALGLGRSDIVMKKAAIQGAMGAGFPFMDAMEADGSARYFGSTRSHISSMVSPLLSVPL